MKPVIDTILESFGPPARRYPVLKGEYGKLLYGPWSIYYEMTPIPIRDFDWHWVHEDYDGAGSDPRFGCCASFADCLNEIDEIEDEADAA